MLTQSPAMAAYFEAAVAAGAAPKAASNWIMGEVSRRLNAAEIGIEACPVPPAVLSALLQRVADGTISNNAAKQVFDALWHAPAAAQTDALAQVDAVIAAKGLRQMNDSGALQAIVEQVIAANPKNVAEYRAGKDKAFNALVGQVMKATQGKANPQQVNELLKRALG
jgi:aspartyl-tRNA(Asn)/glutamyl-tRNA(Gln) amidotransferase subunit B